MASLNKAMIIGNAGKDAELRYMASGTPQSQFSVAVNNRRKDGDEWKDETEWFNVILWGDYAERISGHITKGKQVYVEGRMQTRSWEGDDGQKHYRTELVGQTVQLLGKNEVEERAPRGHTDAEKDNLPFE